MGQSLRVGQCPERGDFAPSISVRKLTSDQAAAHENPYLADYVQGLVPASDGSDEGRLVIRSAAKARLRPASAGGVRSARHNQRRRSRRAPGSGADPPTRDQGKAANGDFRRIADARSSRDMFGISSPSFPSRRAFFRLICATLVGFWKLDSVFVPVAECLFPRRSRAAAAQASHDIARASIELASDPRS